MSDARMATWAIPLLENPCSVLGVHALFQLPPTSKHPWMDGIACLASLFNYCKPFCATLGHWLNWPWQVSQCQTYS